MNKKIKIIELLNKIANGEEVPSNIKVEDKEYCLDGSTYYTVGEDDEDLFCLESYTNTLDFLKLEVKILEDNTEEIEELKRTENVYDMTLKCYHDIEKKISNDELADKINEIIRYIKRKEKNND